MDIKEMLNKEQELLKDIEKTKDMIKTLQSQLIKLENILFNERQKMANEIVNTYKQAIKEKDKQTNTYNITINTHGCDTKSPQELAEKFIKALKAKGAAL
jgi:recombinational DNA repair ATPase RecF